MANVARAIEQAASSKMDDSLWWDSHESLFKLLDDFLSGARKPSPEELVERLQANCAWLTETLSSFRPPNAKSRSALDIARIVINGHSLEINSEKKNVALQISRQLVLDEVQSYLLVSRCFGDETPSANLDSFQKIILKYYTERRCLLECLRLLLLSHTADLSLSSKSQAIKGQIKALVVGGLEDKILVVLEKLLTIEQPLELDLTFIGIWAEQVVIEEYLVMDIIFLLYFEPLSSCTFDRWKKLFIMFKDRIFAGTNVERLSVTAEAMRLAEHVRHQAVLIMLETLDLDKVLLMVFEDVSFSPDKHTFSIEELQEMDRMFGELNPSQVQDYAPLLLGWATFGCLVSYLRASQTGALEMNYTTYMQQAHEGGAFNYMLDMLNHKCMQEASIDGYKCVIKSTISSFIAAYDIANQNDYTIIDTVIDILYAIYVGQEILCAEFWDRESILDSPLRNLLYSLRQYFPHRMKPLALLLAGLAEGPWPAECVYNFLCRPSDVTCMHQHDTDFSKDTQLVTASTSLPLPGASGLLIPAGAVGECLRVMNDQTSLVLWQCKHSALVLLVLHLTELSISGESWARVHAIVNLFHRMLIGNKKLAVLILELNEADMCREARADGRMQATSSVDFLAIICMLLNKILEVPGWTASVALCMEILGAFADCSPYKVMQELEKTQSTWSSSTFNDGGLLSKALSSISRDSERSRETHLLVISVLDICGVFVKKGINLESVSKLVLHFVGTLFVNHMTLKYEQKYERWKITTKVFELAQLVLSDPQPSMAELKARLLELLMVDGAFHSVLLRILSTSMADIQGLYFNRFAELKEIEWFERAITNGLILLHQVLSSSLSSNHLDDHGYNSPLEHALLHHSIGTFPFIACIASLTEYSQNEALQLASVKMLGTMCIVAGKAKPHPLSILSYIQAVDQKQCLVRVFRKLLCEETAELNMELFQASAHFIATAAKYQACFLDMLLLPVKDMKGSSGDVKGELSKNIGIAEDPSAATINESLWNMLTHGQSLFESNSQILSGVLFVLRSLWEGGSEFPDVLESFREREGFWRNLALFISNMPSVLEDSTSIEEMFPRCFQYQCQTYAFQILSWEFFLQTQIRIQKSALSHGEHGSGIAVPDVCNSRASAVCFAVVQIMQAVDPVKLIQCFAISCYDKEVVARARGEIRVLLVALMLKLLINDPVGLSASLHQPVQDSLKAVLNHSSFQKLSNTYLSQGYGRGKELYALIISDLYFHLQGELEAGRHIPAGSFKDLVEFLDTMDMRRVVQYSKETKSGLEYHKGLTYNVSHLREQMGLDCWRDSASHILQTAEATLGVMEQANRMVCLGESQASALEALTSLFSFIATSKQVVGMGLSSNWVASCTVELCNSIEFSLELLGPEGDPSHYIPGFILGQLMLLLVLLEWFFFCGDSDMSKAGVSMVCTKVISTLVAAFKPISSSFLAPQAVQRQLSRSVVGAYLVCLELLQAQDFGIESKEIESEALGGDDNTMVSQVTLKSMEFLPFVCSLVAEKEKSLVIPAISVISVLIKRFLAPQTWVPVLQMYSTVGSALSLLCAAENETESTFQVLSLLLSLSHIRGGVQLLEPAGVFSHLLLFTERIKEHMLCGEVDGPFTVWKARTRRHELWGLSVAIVAGIVHGIRDCNRSSAMESAFVFLKSQKEHMLHALEHPGPSNPDEKKKVRFGYFETSISALEETQQVLHLMAVLVGHHTQWSSVMEGVEEDFRHRCIHLLAYIAREGLTRNVSGSIKAVFRCQPVSKEEILFHRKSSLVGSMAGWFGLAAKGAPAPGVDDEGSSQEGRVPTQYTDSVALYVYRISLLLLEILCKQAQHAAAMINEGRPSSSTTCLEFPAPEILYGLQDQVISVVRDIAGRAVVKEEAEQTCRLMLSIMEKALCLEVCIARICGVGPLSVRAEDVSKDFKSLLKACERHQFLNTPLKALKPILGFAYPAVGS